MASITTSVVCTLIGNSISISVKEPHMLLFKFDVTAHKPKEWAKLYHAAENGTPYTIHYKCGNGMGITTDKGRITFYANSHCEKCGGGASFNFDSTKLLKIIKQAAMMCKLKYV